MVEIDDEIRSLCVVAAIFLRSQHERSLRGFACYTLAPWAFVYSFRVSGGNEWEQLRCEFCEEWMMLIGRVGSRRRTEMYVFVGLPSWLCLDS